MTDLVAILGLLASVNLVTTVALTLYLLRLREQTTHMKDLVTTLIREYEQTTGNRVAVDTRLLGEPQDVVADEGSDVFSHLPEARPWGVK